MTPTKGWSLDFTGSRRLTVTISLALLMTAFGRPASRRRSTGERRHSRTLTTDYTGAQAWGAAGFNRKGVEVA